MDGVGFGLRSPPIWALGRASQGPPGASPGGVFGAKSSQSLHSLGPGLGLLGPGLGLLGQGLGGPGRPWEAPIWGYIGQSLLQERGYGPRALWAQGPI